MGIADLAYIDAAGYHFPDYPTVLAYYQGQYESIFGADTYLEADAKDKQDIAIRAQATYDALALGAAIYNSLSPATAQGTGLSNNVQINGINRQSASSSTVDLVIVGQAGTVITNGQAQDNLQQNWDLPATVTIPFSGTITVLATAGTPGAQASAANTITVINTPTLGWQTVNNPAAATVGAAAETDALLRIRQGVSTALPSQTVMDKIIGAVANVPGVTAYAGYQNPTNSTDVNGLPPYNIALVAEGGDPTAIAQAIALSKAPGVPTYGTTTELVYDAQGVPNNINFYVLSQVEITVVVNIHALQGYSSAYAAQIQQAVMAYINGLEIGEDVYYTRLYAPANLLNTIAGNTFDIISILICRTGSPAASNVTIAFNEQAFCHLTDITVNLV